MSGVAGWLSRPEWAGVGILAIALVAVPAAWRRFLGRLGRRPPSEVSGYVQFSGRPREDFLERVWSQRIVNGLEQSLQHATEMHLDAPCGSGVASVVTLLRVARDRAGMVSIVER